MGYATTRTLERVAAALGELESAPIQFQATCDVAGGGVLPAAPALLAAGLLRHRPPSYQLPPGSYGLDSVFLWPLQSKETRRARQLVFGT
jgi:hypothetical protein